MSRIKLLSCLGARSARSINYRAALSTNHWSTTLLLAAFLLSPLGISSFCQEQHNARLNLIKDSFVSLELCGDKHTSTTSSRTIPTQRKCEDGISKCGNPSLHPLEVECNSGQLHSSTPSAEARKATTRGGDAILAVQQNPVSSRTKEKLIASGKHTFGKQQRE